GRRNAAAGCTRLRPQRLQDRTGATGYSAYAGPGGARDAAIASGQAHQVAGGVMTLTSSLGKPTSRVDGRAKVTGVAKYAAEYNLADVAHGVVVSSAIAKGRIKRIDAGDALAVA